MVHDIKRLFAEKGVVYRIDCLAWQSNCDPDRPEPWHVLRSRHELQDLRLAIQRRLCVSSEAFEGVELNESPDLAKDLHDILMYATLVRPYESGEEFYTGLRADVASFFDRTFQDAAAQPAEALLQGPEWDKPMDKSDIPAEEWISTMNLRKHHSPAHRPEWDQLEGPTNMTDSPAWGRPF